MLSVKAWRAGSGVLRAFPAVGLEGWAWFDKLTMSGEAAKDEWRGGLGGRTAR